MTRLDCPKTQADKGSFTMADSNLFFSPFEILPMAPENKYLKKFSFFIIKSYAVCTH